MKVLILSWQEAFMFVCLFSLCFPEQQLTYILAERRFWQEGRQSPGKGGRVAAGKGKPESWGMGEPASEFRELGSQLKRYLLRTSSIRWWELSGCEEVERTKVNISGSSQRWQSEREPRSWDQKAWVWLSGLFLLFSVTSEKFMCLSFLISLLEVNITHSPILYVIGCINSPACWCQNLPYAPSPLDSITNQRKSCP